jgi:hypothetical protein
LERGVSDQLEFQSFDQENFLLLEEFDIANVLKVDDSHESLDAFFLFNNIAVFIFFLKVKNGLTFLSENKN